MDSSAVEASVQRVGEYSEGVLAEAWDWWISAGVMDELLVMDRGLLESGRVEYIT